MKKLLHVLMVLILCAATVYAAITLGNVAADDSCAACSTDTYAAFNNNGGTVVALDCTVDNALDPTGQTSTWNTSEALLPMWSVQDTGVSRYHSLGWILQGATTGSHDLVQAYGIATADDASTILYSLSGVGGSNTAGTTWRTPGTATQITTGAASGNHAVNGATNGDLAIDHICVGEATTLTASQTAINTVINFSGGDGHSHGSAYANVTGATNMAYTISAGERYGTLIAAAIIPAGAGAATPHNFGLTGILPSQGIRVTNWKVVRWKRGKVVSIREYISGFFGF